MPQAPRNLRIDDIKKNSVTLSWESPESDGGGAIIGYCIEKQTSYSSRWVPVNRAPVTAQMFTVRDVSEGEDCNFRVAAVNDAGIGSPSESTGVVRPRDLNTKPGKPGQLIVELDASRKIAELRWSKPKDDGPTRISNYIIEMRSTKSHAWKVSLVLALCV